MMDLNDNAAAAPTHGPDHTPEPDPRCDHLFKLILVGDQSVGKTNLAMAFCSNNYGPSYMATIGIDFKVKTVTIRNKRVKLQIWDTAGQERYRTLSTVYYRGAHGVLFVFDITNRASFENVKNWISIFEDVTGDSFDTIQKLLVGNKCDNQEGRAVHASLGESVATRCGMKYYETSARTGANVEGMFHDLASDILNFQEQKLADDVPASISLAVTGNKKRRRKYKRGFTWCGFL